MSLFAWSNGPIIRHCVNVSDTRNMHCVYHCGGTYDKFIAAGGVAVKVSHFSLDFAIEAWPRDLVILTIESCGLKVIPQIIFNITRLKELNLPTNDISHIPSEVVALSALERLALPGNCLLKVNSAIARLPSLKVFDINGNPCTWLPSSLISRATQIPERLVISSSWGSKLIGNRESFHCSSPRMLAHFSATAHMVCVFANEFAEACIGLQDLGLPALVTLEILDALCPNAVPMHKKWDLIVAVKHFRDT